MTYIQPMNAAQFADFLLTMEVDDAAQFAIDYCGDTPETPSEDDLFRWHYVQKTAMERFDLRYAVFFYVDELGDENPFVIPFNNYQQAPDDNDRMQIPLYVRELFVHLGVGEDGTVYVERENTDESEAGEQKMVDCYGNWTFDPNDPEEKRNDMDRVALWVLQQGYTPRTTIENLTVVLMLQFEGVCEAENRPYPDSEHLVEAISKFVFESGGIHEFDYEP